MRKLVIEHKNSDFEIKDVPISLTFDELANRFQQALDVNNIQKLYLFDTETNTFCCWSIDEAGYLMGTNDYWKKIISKIVKSKFDIDLLPTNKYRTIVNNIKKTLIKAGIPFSDIEKTEYGLKIYLDKNTIKWKIIGYYDVVDTVSWLKLKNKIHDLFSDIECEIHYSASKDVWVEFYL